MKKFTDKISIIILLIAISVFTAHTVVAGVPSDFPYGVATGNIANTPHNLGATSQYITDGSTNMCIFCHTPHIGLTDAPLWNRQTLEPFTAYGTTIAGSFVGDEDISSTSLACLTCHDGVTSFDSLINAPGKGNGGVNTNEPINFDWTFTVDGNTVSDVITSPAAIIGTDLTNDHPISILYQENIASLRPTNTVISDLVMTTETLTIGAGSDASSTTAISNRWAVSGFISSSATIADLLTNGKVECSSCHDPHFQNTSWDEVESTWSSAPTITGLFLRRVGGNSVSGVCRTCHAK